MFKKSLDDCIKMYKDFNSMKYKKTVIFCILPLFFLLNYNKMPIEHAFIKKIGIFLLGLSFVLLLFSFLLFLVTLFLNIYEYFLFNEYNQIKLKVNDLFDNEFRNLDIVSNHGIQKIQSYVKYDKSPSSEIMFLWKYKLISFKNRTIIFLPTFFILLVYIFKVFSKNIEIDLLNQISLNFMSIKKEMIDEVKLIQYITILSLYSNKLREISETLNRIDLLLSLKNN